MSNFDNVSDDLADWKLKVEQSPTTVHANGSDRMANPKFDNFEILPHNYTDKTDVYISTRDPYEDFAQFKLENGSMQNIANYSGYIGKDASKHLNADDNRALLYSGLDESGKRFVTFLTHSKREDHVGRKIYQKTLLVSPDGNYTQAQKDILKVFSTTDLKSTTTPLDFATITPSPEFYKEKQYKTNKNALLSAISSWAKNSKDFDVNALIQSSGDVIKI